MQLSVIVIVQMLKNKKLVITFIFILALLGLVGWWYSQRERPRELEDAKSIGQQTKGETQQGVQTPKPGKKDEGDSSQTLLEPSGNFVSSHEAGMNSLVASSCVTTSGAICTISFTKSGVTKTLPSQTTDREGAAFWEWTPKQVGLSPGEWTIEAKANKSGQDKTAKDAEVLKVL